MDYAFGVVSKKSSPTQSYIDFCLLEFLYFRRNYRRSAIAFHFIFGFMMHFELIFVKSVRSMFRLHHLLKKVFILHWIAFPPLSKIYWLYLFGSIFFFWLSSLVQWSVYYSFTSTMLVLITWLLELYNKYWNLLVVVLVLQLSLFQNCHDYSRSFEFPCESSHHFVSFYKQAYWDVGWDCVESVDNFGGRIDTLNNIDSSDSCSLYIKKTEAIDFRTSF